VRLKRRDLRNMTLKRWPIKGTHETDRIDSTQFPTEVTGVESEHWTR